MKNRSKIFAQDDFVGILIAQVDGSAVTTTSAVTGLLQGSQHVKVKKGSGGTSNVVTVALNESLVGVAMVVPVAITANVQFKTVSTAAGAVITVTESDDNSSGVDDADFMMLIVGIKAN